MSPLSVEKQRRLKPSPKGEGWMRGNKSLDFILLIPALSPAGERVTESYNSWYFSWTKLV